MTRNRIPMTPDGHRKMQANLDRLIKTERPQNIKDIAEARAHGDLSENAEYHAAKERQSFIEGRIIELQDKLSRAEVIDPASINHNRVSFGATVTLLDINTDKEIIYTLVSTDEADVKQGRISISSPVGKALIGKEIGDTAVIIAPGKTMEYEIAGIRFI